MLLRSGHLIGQEARRDEEQETSQSTRRAVKDLTAKSAKAVKGGELAKACATGEHIKKAVLFVR